MAFGNQWDRRPDRQQNRRNGLVLRLAASAALAALLAGCETTASSGPTYTGSIGDSTVVVSSDLSQDQALAAVQQWGDAYSRNEKDAKAALNYAAALRAAGLEPVT